MCAGLKSEIELLRIVFAVVSLRARVPAAAIIVEMDSGKVSIQQWQRFSLRKIRTHHEYNFANYIRKRAENNIFA